MSIRIMSAVWELDLQASEKLVLLALADNANDEGLCWPSIATIARKCGKGDRSVQQAIQELQKLGHLTRDEVVGKGCRYTIHPRNNCAPAENSPPQKTTDTPAESAPKPSRTINTSEAKASSVTRAPKANAFPAPADVPDSVWKDFLASPKRKKAGMSQTAYAGIVNNLMALTEHGYPPGDMIALAVERGWTTIKLEWVQNDERSQANRGGNGRMGGPRPDPVLAMRRAAADALARGAEHRERSWPALPSR